MVIVRKKTSLIGEVIYKLLLKRMLHMVRVQRKLNRKVQVLKQEVKESTTVQENWHKTDIEENHLV